MNYDIKYFMGGLDYLTSSGDTRTEAFNEFKRNVKMYSVTKHLFYQKVISII
jgi:hypothetical protein